MAAQVILEFEGLTTREYDAVNATLGLDPAKRGRATGPMASNSTRRV